MHSLAELTSFRKQMDGLLTAELAVKKRVVVVGATNRPQDLDAALLRRLSRRILVDLPTLEQRKGKSAIVSLEIVD